MLPETAADTPTHPAHAAATATKTRGRILVVVVLAPKQRNVNCSAARVVTTSIG